MNFARTQANYVETRSYGQSAMRLYGVTVNGERKNLFVELDKAREIKAAVVGQGGKAATFKHSAEEIRIRDAKEAEDQFFDLGMKYYIAARSSAVQIGLMPVCGNLLSSRCRDVFEDRPVPKLFSE